MFSECLFLLQSVLPMITVTHSHDLMTSRFPILKKQNSPTAETSLENNIQTIFKCFE